MWKDISEPWQECFRLGWKSYIEGSIPIGAVVVDDNDTIISRGRNLIYDNECESNEIHRHDLSHAELNALLKVSEFDHPNIRSYTLYTTTEPCPLCFGALVMASIRTLKFAARDRHAGSTNLNNASNYIKSKNIRISSPFDELEKVQIALHTEYELHKCKATNKVLAAWRLDCEIGVDAGVNLFNAGIVKQLKNSKADVSKVYNTILMNIYKIKAD